MPDFETIGKSKQFYDFLKNEIMSDEYQPGDKFVSIRDLAEKYHISKITVNSVIASLVTEGYLSVVQGRGTFVSEKKRKAARSKKMIGVMMFDFRVESDVEIGVFNAIQDHLKKDYYVIPYNSYNRLDTFYRGLKGFQELDVDGMILVPPMLEDYDAARIRSLIKADVPVVLINRNIPCLQADFFAMDFAGGIDQATRHLLQKGSRQILLVKHCSPSIGKQMAAGYARALGEWSLAAEERLIVSSLPYGQDAEAILTASIGQVDGIIASDHFLYKGRKIIGQSGRRGTGELAIVGVNDTIYSKFMDPPISSVPFPSEEIGKAAIQAMIDRIENKRIQIVEQTFARDLVVRD